VANETAAAFIRRFAKWGDISPSDKHPSWRVLSRAEKYRLNRLILGPWWKG
jgi:hypothetical protein